MSYTETEYRIATWLRIELKEMNRKIAAGQLSPDVLTTGYPCSFTPGDGTWMEWLPLINDFLRSDKGKREFGDNYVVEYSDELQRNVLYKR